ncbi:tetratricopeptide repeat protein [Azospirillum soli]|uniref:tetratricopeptide repeat-containing glycosyltransferase family protein n=1 Tax=Azospirillum soli TaxID=1304799 RepID=UPI001AE0EB33|nr:tetratricopeptide repeat-containing glycosyltransferase family protein [Azospirillum soli]MBP2316833.1 Tfp pilus assembly protein PilF [Azospirillum soli]
MSSDNITHPDDAYALARRHFDAGNPGEAARICHAIVERHPRHGRSLQLLGTLAHRKERFGLAVDFFRHALAAMPHDAGIRNNLATALKDWGRLEAAEEHFRTLLAEAPGLLAGYYNYANLLQRLQHFGQAIDGYRRAVAIDPDCVEAHWNLALNLLRAGRFDEAWAEYEWRWRRPGTPVEHRGAPLWDGGPLHGRTLLLVCEQGLGDTLQFLRYVPFPKEPGGPVILRCQAELMRLLEGHPGIDRIVATQDPLPPFDVQSSLMSLPGLFGTTVGSIPDAVPYLRVPEGRPELPEGGFRVGLVWGSSPTDPSRSCPLAALTRLGRIADLRVFSLQKGPHAGQLAETPCTGFITDLSERIGDMADTAAFLEEMDLVVTVDTSVAHLAGALGRPTWILLPHLADWRWLLDRDDSPWYPTARLFRQTAPGDWDGVAARLEEALVRHVQAWRSNP